MIRAIALVAVATSSAAADDAHRLVALAGTQIAVGPGGEVYEPDAHGAWQRTKAGGIGPAVTATTRTATQTIAGTTFGAFRLGSDGWSVIYLGQHAKPIIAAGTRAVAAVGRQLFVLEGAAATGHAPAAAALAPSPITAVGASATGIVIATATGVLRLDGKAFVPVPRVPAGVSFAGGRYALAGAAAYDMKSGMTIAWAAGDSVTAASEAADGALVAAATTATGVVYLRAHDGTIDRDATGVTGTPIGVGVERDGRAVVALADGRICVRDHGAWSTQTIHDAFPPPRPGSPPASSH